MTKKQQSELKFVKRHPKLLLKCSKKYKKNLNYAFSINWVRVNKLGNEEEEEKEVIVVVIAVVVIPSS